MTQLQVLLFASYAEAFGSNVVTVTVPDAATTADVVEALRDLPGGHVLPSSPLFAVDRRFTRGIVAVTAEQELALIPPVAGG
jgi:molybdopterin converting factor small subunit